MKRLQLVTREDEEEEDSLYQDFLSEFDYLQPAQSDATPPRVLLSSSPSSEREEATIITRQPPREVRTSKAKDKRAFTCAIKPDSTATTTCNIVFCDTLEPVPGEQTFTCNALGEFTDLQVLTPSLKYNDRDMCLQFQSPNNNGYYSQSFYSYSNVGVLKRRREVELVALSTSNNKRRFHVVGKTFFASSKLAVVFRFQAAGGSTTAWRMLLASNLECYSDSVLFFDPPTTNQLVNVLGCTPGCNNRVFVQCTNDGRNCSNALEHCLYVPLASPRSLPSYLPLPPDSSEEEFQARL
ncbi:hypothetical protein BASA81_003537 [Batrachochytrium salamandrivorans]|nr:hypothetical protein BASA81_003537 [Batrachochytrium salamandrivorans]